jgi:hypothetical protein
MVGAKLHTVATITIVKTAGANLKTTPTTIGNAVMPSSNRTSTP